MQNLVKIIFIVTFLISNAIFATSKINLNNANAAELVHIVKGIGIKKAQAIVSYRKQHGNFKAIEDLANVPRIGKNFIQKNQQELAAKLTLH